MGGGPGQRWRLFLRGRLPRKCQIHRGLWLRVHGGNGLTERLDRAISAHCLVFTLRARWALDPPRRPVSDIFVARSSSVRRVCVCAPCPSAATRVYSRREVRAFAFSFFPFSF